MKILMLNGQKLKKEYMKIKIFIYIADEKERKIFMYCKKRNRNCRYEYHQNSYQCRKCIEENLSQYPITCEDCRYSFYECVKRGKNQRKMRPCNDFKWS